MYIDDLMKLSPEGVKLSEIMALHTTFRVGGPADCCFFPKSAEEIIKAMEIARENSIPCFVMGNGSNLIVTDKGIRGLVIILSDAFSMITVDGRRITAQAGAPLAKAANTAMEHSLSGLEFASGIPGSVGGGVAMNAGAYGGEIKDVLAESVAFDPALGEIVRLPLDEHAYGYRDSIYKHSERIVLAASFRLVPGDREEIAAKMNDIAGRRVAKQPLEYPSAGSVFKRPEGHFVGQMVEESGLKGYSIGSAEVSEKHAGFIVNRGGATSRDVLALVEHIRDVVRNNYAVELECEIIHVK